jgi:hypothetical protein
MASRDRRSKGNESREGELAFPSEVVTPIRPATSTDSMTSVDSLVESVGLVSLNDGLELTSVRPASGKLRPREGVELSPSVELTLVIACFSQQAPTWLDKSKQIPSREALDEGQLGKHIYLSQKTIRSFGRERSIHRHVLTAMPSPFHLAALPLEIIELILSYIFLPPSPLTPASDPYHLRGTSHILLVSHAIRRLALPFFYHTVIISRQSHLTTFFDPEHGLFSAGDSAQRRWNMVRELGLVLGVEAPIALDVTLPQTSSYLLPLSVPERSPILTLCLFHEDTGKALESERDIEALVALAQADENSRRRIEQDLFDEYEDDLNVLDRSFGDWVYAQYNRYLFAEIDERIDEPIWTGARVEKEQFFQILLKRTRPIEIRWAAHELLYHEQGVLSVRLEETTLVVHPPPWALLDKPISETLATIGEGESQLGVKQIRLEGFDDAALDELATMVPALAFTAWNDGNGPNRISEATWSWTRSDGTVISFSPPVSRIP